MAVVYMTGVLEDGTTVRDPAVPINPRVALEVIQETTTRVLVSVVNPAGVPIPTVGAGTFTLTVKKRPQDIPPVAVVQGIAIAPNLLEFTFAASTLRGFEWGRYCYDIRAAQGGAQNLLVPTSPFLLSPAVSAAS